MWVWATRWYNQEARGDRRRARENPGFGGSRGFSSFVHPNTRARNDTRSPSPNGATVNSQGREPLETVIVNGSSPNGAVVLSPRWGWRDPGSSNQGLTPLAIDGRPVGADLRVHLPAGAPEATWRLIPIGLVFFS
jgi:hypothetical protein